MNRKWQLAEQRKYYCFLMAPGWAKNVWLPVVSNSRFPTAYHAGCPGNQWVDLILNPDHSKLLVLVLELGQFYSNKSWARPGQPSYSSPVFHGIKTQKRKVSESCLITCSMSTSLMVNLILIIKKFGPAPFGARNFDWIDLRRLAPLCDLPDILQGSPSKNNWQLAFSS